jgi:hypothetical protein
MVNRDSEIPSNPLVETAFKAIATWVSNYRYAMGCFGNEFGKCGPDEVKRMVEQIGVTPGQLQKLANNGPGNADLLKKMLVALHVDPKVLADMDPLILRELRWLCITCSDKERCKHELAQGTAAEHLREFCPNAVSLDELLAEETQPSSH